MLPQPEAVCPAVAMLDELRRRLRQRLCWWLVSPNPFAGGALAVRTCEGARDAGRVFIFLGLIAFM